LMLSPGGRPRVFRRLVPAREIASEAPPPRPAGATTATLLALLLFAVPAFGARVKDIASIEGVRPNQLWGYGIIAGLTGTGDSQQSIFTVQSVLNMLRRKGLTLNVNPRQLQIKNVASVG